MSTTSGPMLPSRTGNSTDLPSPYCRTAFLVALMRAPGSAATQQLDDLAHPGISASRAPADEVPEIGITVLQQRLERPQPPAFQPGGMTLQKPFQHEVIFQQTAPAAPADSSQFGRVHALNPVPPRRSA